MLLCAPITITDNRGFALETHGPLGLVWVSFGLIGFYIALLWLNTLLGFFLTPLFVIPTTRVYDLIRGRRRRTEEPPAA